MLVPLIMIVITLILMFICIIFDLKITVGKIKVSAYWVVCFLSAILCIVCGFISHQSLKNVFISSSNINPLKILIIFLSCTSLSVLLDQIGFFQYIAQLALKKAKSSQTKLFFVFNFIIILLTIFTSNDILILTFTPFICYFAKRAKIDATPYIVSEFVMANAWSMFFYIDNPTNIYICANFGITFIDYTIKMALPTIVAGATSLLLVYLLFRKKLKQKLEIDEVAVIKPNPISLAICLSGLGIMILFMIICPYIGLEIWYIPPICAGLTYLIMLIYMLKTKQKLAILNNAIKKLPYALIPFFISMAVLVATLQDIGFVEIVANLLSNKHFFVIGIIAFLAGNLINNIPMSMLFTNILMSMPFVINNVYAVIIASNLCAFLTPVGALAGIMFMKILKENDVPFSFKNFIFYGTIVSIPTILLSLCTLLIV